MTIPKLSQWQPWNKFQLLRQMSAAQWTLMELKEDPLFCRIDPQQVPLYVNAAIADGKLKSEYYDKIKMFQILKQKNVAVAVNKDGSPYQVHSQVVFRGKEIRIEIDAKTVKELNCSLYEMGVKVSTGKLILLHLAHEFYHCLEYWDQEEIGKRCPKVTYPFFGIFPCRGYVRRTSEAAAHIFATEICGLDFHPKLLDYLLLEKSNKDVADDYFNACIETCGR